MIKHKKINQKSETITALKDQNECRQWEEKLRESSERLQTLINAMPDIVCFKDGTGRWLEANSAILKTFQLAQVDYQGKTDAELASILEEVYGFSIYKDSLLTCSQTDEEAWRKKELSRGEEFIPQPDGTLKIYDVIKVPLFHPNGERKELVIWGRDITQRKQTEIAYKQLASMVESSDDGIIGTTVDGTIINWNAGAEKIYGYTTTEIQGTSFSVVTLPERSNEMPQILETIQLGGSIDHYETVHLRQDDQPIDVSLTISPIRDARGKITGVATIARDISYRKRVEKTLEQLRHQNELILNSAGEGIFGLNREGKITFVNPAASRMTGYEFRELVMSDCRLITGSNSQIYATLEDGITRHVIEEMFYRQDGKKFAVEYVSTPMQQQGVIIGAVVTFKDITERQAMEKMKDEFISVVSHELRTPLTSIHGALGLLSSGLLDTQPERAKRMLEIAVSNTDRLVRLINDILDLERTQSGQITLIKQTHNLADLMTQATNEMLGMAEKAGVTLAVTLLAQEICVASDRIIQMLTNLLSNAIRFSPMGSTVWFEAQLCSISKLNRTQLEKTEGSEPMEILITVRDQGRGIPPDKLETIFGRFQQVDASDSRQKGGTGLGLAICRSIVQQHGGKIWAESTLGKGSTFFVRLPRFQEERG